MVLAFDPKWQKYVIAKGYIAVNGCSLTIGRVEEGASLHLIPETLRLTNLEDATPGAKFNIEFDHQTMTIVETVERVRLARLVVATPTSECKRDSTPPLSLPASPMDSSCPWA